MRRSPLLSIVLIVAATRLALATPRTDLSDDAIFGPPEGFRIDSLRLRFTHIEQDGRGYQSQAERRSVTDPGRERVTIEQPQLEVVAQQGKFTHRLFVPADIVTAASPDATDVISHASRVQEAGTFDISTRYHQSKVSDVLFRASVHLEENFRSWLIGLGGSRAFADDNTVVSATFNQVVDWLDAYDFTGARHGRSYRSTSNLNLGVTQLLSPTTVAFLGYGGTLQLGELSNTWNAARLGSGALTTEKLPHMRHRHAFVARLAQSVPIGMVVKLLYRFYTDSWHLQAHTVEAEIYQRLARFLYVRFTYRLHVQSAVSFWTIAADADAPAFTADSDLAHFVAQTFGGLVAVEVPAGRYVKNLHIDFGYDHYQRSNSLHADLYTCGFGFRF